LKRLVFETTGFSPYELCYYAVALSSDVHTAMSDVSYDDSDIEDYTATIVLIHARASMFMQQLMHKHMDDTYSACMYACVCTHECMTNRLMQRGDLCTSKSVKS
jgi:hypothetical protein